MLPGFIKWCLETNQMKDFQMGALDAFKSLFQNYFLVFMCVCVPFFKKKRRKDFQTWKMEMLLRML